MTLEILVLAWDRHKHMVALNRLMGSQPPPLCKIALSSIYSSTLVKNQSTVNLSVPFYCTMTNVTNQSTVNLSVPFYCTMTNVTNQSTVNLSVPFYCTMTNVTRGEDLYFIKMLNTATFLCLSCTMLG